MAGSIEGGKLAAETNKAKYGSDYYAKIGAKGGRISRRRKWQNYPSKNL